MQNRGLGRGLSALISEDYSVSTTEEEGDKKSNRTHSLDLDRLVSGKFQPRRKFTEKYLNELAESIRKNGIMQPIIVRLSPDFEGKYEIIAGERRWRAAKMAGLSDVPVIIRDIDDQQALELALVENIQRQDLTPLEEAIGYQRLIDEFSYTQEELSKTVGKSRSHVANMLRLLMLPKKIKDYLDDGKITMGHARALLNAPDSEKLVEEVIKRGLNVRQTENLSRINTHGQNIGKSSSGKGKKEVKEKDPDIIALEETLSESLGLKVSIDDKGEEGKIIISYDSLAQLDIILQKLSE